MKWLFILFLCLIFYYIISRTYKKYIENFDPSLVPVSSLITLAKVAQKLVDSGTLTNPGNLQIGTPSARADLTVTGNTLLGTLNSGSGTMKSTAITAGTASPDANIIKFGDGTGSRIKYATNPASGTSVDTGTHIYDNGQVNVGTVLNVGSSLYVPSATISGTLNVGTITGNISADGSGGSELRVLSQGPNISKLSLNTPGAVYKFSATDSSYTAGGGLVPNHLQLFSYGAGAPPANQINQLIDMYPSTTGGANTINLVGAVTASNSLTTPSVTSPTINVNGYKLYSTDGTKFNIDSTTTANIFTVDSSGNGTLAGDLKINGSLNILPKGSIMMWNTATAPAGWAFCDGSGGTPDMRDKLIRASSTITSTLSESSIYTGDDYTCAGCQSPVSIPTYVINFIMKL